MISTPAIRYVVVSTLLGILVVSGVAIFTLAILPSKPESAPLPAPDSKAAVVVDGSEFELHVPAIQAAPPEPQGKSGSARSATGTPVPGGFVASGAGSLMPDPPAQAQGNPASGYEAGR